MFILFILVGDIVGGVLYFVVGVLLIFYRVGKLGKGVVVDVVIVDGLVYMMNLIMYMKGFGVFFDICGYSMLDGLYWSCCY